MSGRLAFVGDVHLLPDDPLLEEFLRLLEGLGQSCSRIIFTGDLFNVWLGRQELEQPHHTAVLSKLSELRERGIVLRYIEGNHDFRVGSSRAAQVFDDICDETLAESFGGLSILAAHGDLANSEDRRYRRWRRFARYPLVWWLFNRLPRRARLRLAEWTERRLRSSNLEHKREFPTEQVLAYAASFLEGGHDLIVMGHFHEEREFRLPGAERPVRVVVLPEWKGSRRHLEVDGNGELSFVDHRPG